MRDLPIRPYIVQLRRGVRIIDARVVGDNGIKNEEYRENICRLNETELSDELIEAVLLIYTFGIYETRDYILL